MDRELSNGDEGEELIQAQAHIMNHMLNYISSMSLKCAVQLGIPEIIHNHHQQGGPITLSELVKALGISETNTTYVHRLMRMLVHSGFFTIKNIHDENEEEREGYVPTLSSKLLLKSHPMSMSPNVLTVLDPDLLKPWHFINEWFKRSDEDQLITPFEATSGMSFWKYLGEKQESGKLFDKIMACDANLVMSVVLKECKVKFEGLRSLVDVGGGTGTAAKAIAEAFPDVKCTVLDLPRVVGNLKGSENVEFVSGDMFESIPSAQAVFLKFVVHDWNDEECVEILKRCRESIPSKEEGGKVIIIDMVVGDTNNIGHYESTETQLFYDLLMMAHTTGRERTDVEWEKLFLDAGFTSYKITPILGLRSFIEVFP